MARPRLLAITTRVEIEPNRFSLAVFHLRSIGENHPLDTLWAYRPTSLV